MWTEEQRRIYRREGDGYPSDLRNTEWARLEPLIPSARPGGREWTTTRIGSPSLSTRAWILRPFTFLPAS
jgi:hypothetical protein